MLITNIYGDCIDLLHTFGRTNKDEEKFPDLSVASFHPPIILLQLQYMYMNKDTNSSQIFAIFCEYISMTQV